MKIADKQRIDGMGWIAGLALGLLLFALGCERPPMETRQVGYRGVAMEAVTNPRDQPAILAANRLPTVQPPVPPGSPPASTIFQNVPALGHVEAGEFTRVMAGMVDWVSPQQGCLYCHDAKGFEIDAPYTKIVARRMIEMTQTINSEWKEHVGETGVTCYTCHRGNNIPTNYWSFSDAAPGVLGPAGGRPGHNAPSTRVGLTSLPSDPYDRFLLQARSSRIQSTSALPASPGAGSSIQDVEATYGLMVSISDSLGVNCTHCHNSRSFSRWEQSTPARAKAWYGLEMVRSLNQEFLTPLAPVLPANRKGPHGDPFKVNCATCHQGVSKPLLGAQMLKDYPVLARLAPEPPVSPTPEPVAESAQAPMDGAGEPAPVVE